MQYFGYRGQCNWRWEDCEIGGGGSVGAEVEHMGECYIRLTYSTYIQLNRILCEWTIGI